MRKISIIFALAISVLTACTPKASEEKPAASANTAAAQNTSEPANEVTSAPKLVPKEELKTLTPTQVMKQFAEAQIAKDPEAIKAVLSHATMLQITDSADKQGIPVNEILLNDGGSPMTKVPEIRNEQVDGDTASVEVKNKNTGTFEKMPMVKEQGVWKIALDVYMKELLEKLQKSMSQPMNIEPKQKK